MVSVLTETEIDVELEDVLYEMSWSAFQDMGERREWARMTAERIEKSLKDKKALPHENFSRLEAMQQLDEILLILGPHLTVSDRKEISIELENRISNRWSECPTATSVR